MAKRDVFVIAEKAIIPEIINVTKITNAWIDNSAHLVKISFGGSPSVIRFTTSDDTLSFFNGLKELLRVETI